MQNDDRAPMKVVGRKGLPKADVVSMHGMQQLANALNRRSPVAPKGVFRFRTFEEADAWLIKVKARR